MPVDAGNSPEMLPYISPALRQQKEVNQIIESTFLFTVNPFATLTKSITFLVVSRVFSRFEAVIVIR